jgi:hypothetical protein
LKGLDHDRPSLTADTAPAGVVAGAGVAGAGVAGPPREDASSLIINPPAPAGAPRPLPPPAARPPGKRAERPAASERPERESPPTRVEPTRTEPTRTEPTRAEPTRAESEGEARAAISTALAEAARLLSGRAADAAAPLLDGAVRAQWATLMREGRVSVGVDGTPTVQLDGDRASAEFDATVTVRSPFGANRRRPARFTAELQRSDGRWVVRSIRPLGALSLT